MAEQNLTVEVVLSHSSVLGEGPVWDVRSRSICWVDILSGHIHEYCTTTAAHRVVDVKNFVGAVALCKDGNFVAALKTGIAYVERRTGHVDLLCHPEAHLPGNRYNDGKCDPAGRLWIGSMALSEQAAAGNLYAIRNDLGWELKLPGVSISNGMAWSTDHRVFYYIDSPTRQVAAFDFDVYTGVISNRRTVIEIPRPDGFPDGMAIDNDGKLWIAFWDGWQISRWDPDNGTRLQTIPFPVGRITSCAFGGENMDDLYVTSARTGLTETQLHEQPLAGSLFVVRNCGVSGPPSFEFDLDRSHK